jgi:VWFA-related protein
METGFGDSNFGKAAFSCAQARGAARPDVHKGTFGQAAAPPSAVLVLFGVLMILQPALGRQQKAQERPAYDMVVNAITLSVTVQGRGGRYINDLEEKDFIVYENNEKKKITYFAHDRNAPLSLTVLLDVSGSMALDNKFEECRTALHYLVRQLLSPRDEVALLVFADGDVEVAARHSTDRRAFIEALDKEKAYGMTALNDAVAVSPEFATRAKNEKRALLLITDGIENDSAVGPDEALEIARRVDVPIYVVGYKIPRSETALAAHKRSASLTTAGIVETLTRFAEATGGRAFFTDEPAGLLDAVKEIQKEQSHQYIIGYTSYREDDRYRRIRVMVPGRNFRVRTRQGY